MNKTFNLQADPHDAAANAATYGVRAIPRSYLVTDIFFGFEVWHRQRRVRAGRDELHRRRQ